MPEAAAIPDMPPGGGPGTPPETELHVSIGQAADRTGLSIHTLRFYEREGLLVTPVHRGTDGRRSYTQRDLEWLEVCVKLRASGMPLTAIRRYADLVRQGPGNEEDRLTLLRQHQQHVTTQIAALTECLDLITFKIRLYEACRTQGSPDPLLTPAVSAVMTVPELAPKNPARLPVPLPVRVPLPGATLTETGQIG
jgi:DNA-binding transcriptional MerR regulator